MKLINKIILCSVLIQADSLPQVKDYWKDAPVEGTRIYSVVFTSEQNGFAVSLNDELFITTDAGFRWTIREKNIDAVSTESNEFLWSAEIFCSAMQTIDGGTSWIPYSEGAQEHFCRVYLKDPNVDYKTASEFLNVVSSEILTAITHKHITSLINRPKQCTEYYSNEKEGWAVGWCLKNFKMSKSPEGIK